VIGLVVLVVVGSIMFFTQQNPSQSSPYGGTLALDDPLSTNSSGYEWQDATTVTGCTFTNGAYHVQEQIQGQVNNCIALATTYDNFAYQVQMTIMEGDCGGVVFRISSNNIESYYFRICQDGSYSLSINQISVIRSGYSTNINRGLGQQNLIAATTQGNTITLYVNNQQITSVNDSTYSQGRIGVVADDERNPTEVEFQDAKVWTL
jgi:hypothetical protein